MPVYSTSFPCMWSGCDFPAHVAMLIKVNTEFFMQSACTASQMKLYFPTGNLHLFGLIFSMVCLSGYILKPLMNTASKWFQLNMSVCPIKTFSINTSVTWGNYRFKEEKNFHVHLSQFQCILHPWHVTLGDKMFQSPFKEIVECFRTKSYES